MLDGIDLTIAPGERVALIGVSGAGKTTLARVVAGIQRPTGGRVLLGGVELAQLGRAATARTVGLVSQEVHVFAGTLADDLRMARPAAGRRGARRGAGSASARWSGCARCPTGWRPSSATAAVALTAERAQQLALARIVLADHPIVILDEATAESGSSGARALERAASAALEGRTALVVAHRLTQAAAADRIVVLEAGRDRRAGHARRAGRRRRALRGAVGGVVGWAHVSAQAGARGRGYVRHSRTAIRPPPPNPSDAPRTPPPAARWRPAARRVRVT